MNLLEVHATNLDILHDISAIMKELNLYPKKLDQVLKRVIIRVDVNRISAPEVIALKSIASSVFVKEEKISLDERLALLEGSGVECSEKLKNYIKDVVPENYTCSILPVGCGSYEVSAIFTGNALLGFFDYDFNKFFEVTDQSLTLEKNVENNIIQRFHSMVYKRWFELISNRDMTVDSWLHANAHNRISKTESFRFSRLFDTDGNEASFVDNSEEKLESEISAMKKSYGNEKSHLFVEIACNSSIYLFYQIMINSRYISDFGDPAKLVSPKYQNVRATTQDIIIDQNTIDNNLIESISTLIQLEEEELYYLSSGETEDSGFKDNMVSSPFAKQFYLPAATKIRYSIIFDYSDIMDVREKIYLCGDFDKSIYPESKHLLDVLETVDSIVNGYLK